MALFSDISREVSFLAKQRYLLILFSIAFMLSIFTVWSGISESNAQLNTIERLQEKDSIDRSNVLAKQSDYGSAAYYSFHLTYSKPSSIAFAALGQRDIYPWKHRVRMLALEGQIYETDAANPELSFLGRFDFAFLVSVLLPLFVILLLHDLRSSEREAGRYDLLITTASNQKYLWLSRSIALCTALAIAVITPFVIGAFIAEAPIMPTVQIILVVIGHLVFWLALTLWFTSSKMAIKQSSPQIASVLLSIWLLVSVVIPVGSDFIIDEMVDSPNGGEIVLTQREAVNDAWDLPFSATWNEFLKHQPELKNSTQMNSQFEWKWYYAFQQVGDQKASALSAAYRNATFKKDKLANYFAIISPPMLAQRMMSSIAETDTHAAMRYEQNIRDYHYALRQFYYPLLFGKRAFNAENMSELPQFSQWHEPSKP
ncbi:DUF3526 domain-containing protein [Thalassotalea agariperforans]